MTLRGPLTDQRADLIAERVRVLGQPLRDKLLDRLATQAITVQELVGSLETTQQNVSQISASCKEPESWLGTKRALASATSSSIRTSSRSSNEPRAALRTTSANSQNRSSQALSVGGFRLVNRRHPGQPRIDGPSLPRLRRQINDR